jgi:hypothetical protein
VTAARGSSPVRIARIVVALDEAPASASLLAFACRLAAATGARLTGLFVEDAELLELAGSGLARELGSYSGAERSLSPRELERAMELRAGAAQQLLADAARRAGIGWSFRLLRGRVHRELLSASGPGDLLILGRGRGRGRLGGAVRRLVQEEHGPLLILGAEPREEARLVVVHSGDEDAEPAVLAAAHLAEALGSALEVLLPAGSETLEPRLRELLAGSRFPVRLRPLARPDVDALFATLAPDEADLLVLTPGGPFGGREVELAVLSRARGAVLLLG